ncbi:NAD(P)-binding protein [Exidia glandulosa HHB12029]|uniref:NAD(P)-binding protein n=1 Tax=Exidia glandulosa HHB12029 TaxID=1314781 RepID=A0A165KF17_EXIGL|nr:NAD(P)-binding protein [Exidia glandulosa HHB12029]
MYTRLKHSVKQLFPPAPTWKVDDIPDQTGRVHVVTGGCAGIGYETVKALLNKNAKVYMAARSRAKSEDAIAKLKTETGHEALFLELDLASLSSVKRSAEELLQKEKEIHVLYDNAGVMFTDPKLLTEDGYDLTFGTNVLGHFYFTQLLLPALLAARARVVIVSSVAMLCFPFTTLNMDILKDGPARDKFNGVTSKYWMYGKSKLANCVHAQELHRRYAKDGLTVISVNPGNIRTDLYQHTAGPLRLVAFDAFMHPPPFGALSSLYSGTAPEAAELGGKFIVPWARVGTPAPKAVDPKVGTQLWTWLEEQVSLYEKSKL